MNSNISFRYMADLNNLQEQTKNNDILFFINIFERENNINKALILIIEFVRVDQSNKLSIHWKLFSIKKYKYITIEMEDYLIIIEKVMNTLEPIFLNPSKRSFQTSGKSKQSISIFQSRRAITDLEESIEHDRELQGSLLLVQNRQITSGMIVDVNKYNQTSKVQKQLVAKDGEKDQKVFFSFLVLKEENGKPIQVIYRWIRKLKPNTAKTNEIVITEEEHIYRGQLKDNRKHGNGEYIILRKFSNACEGQIRYSGDWQMDIFNRGTIQDESGLKKQLNHSNFISYKSKRQVKGDKSDRNQTIKMITDQMNKRKSSHNIKQRNSNISCASILDKIKYRQESSIHNIKN